MRHHVAGKKLNRDIKHRKALFRNLTASLVEHGSITTTLAKAKAIKPQIDKLITKAKRGQVHDRRQIASFLPKRDFVNTLVMELAPKTGKRTSGFTRITKLGMRRGDNTMMARLELIDYSPTKSPSDKPGKAKPSTKKPNKKSEDNKTKSKSSSQKQTPSTSQKAPKAPALKRQQSAGIKKV